MGVQDQVGEEKLQCKKLNIEETLQQSFGAETEASAQADVPEPARKKAKTKKVVQQIPKVSTEISQENMQNRAELPERNAVIVVQKTALHVVKNQVKLVEVPVAKVGMDRARNIASELASLVDKENLFPRDKQVLRKRRDELL